MELIKYTINFRDLDISAGEIAKFMGYSDNDVPEPVSQIIEESLKKAEEHCDIRGGIAITDRIKFIDEKNFRYTLEICDEKHGLFLSRWE